MIVHELRVHQVELEMQNDELRKAQVELEQSRSKYAELFDFAPVGYLVFDANGLVVEANLTAAVHARLGSEAARSASPSACTSAPRQPGHVAAPLPTRLQDRQEPAVRDRGARQEIRPA